ncbi:MAG: DNA polymerase I [Candidatus Eisenbacteria bacterium]|nr:DNA polymerase I [Candidatus Eisenbacteria bacterium]
MPRLIVLDALGLAYRAYYAFIGRPLRNPKGENSSAIFGFSNMALKFRRDLEPTLWALAWDGPGPTFRHEMYPEYKAHRPPMPDDLRSQLEPIEELARCIGLPVIEKPGMEADDVMATLARIGAAAGYDVVLVTGDKDMLQVVNERVTVLAPAGKGDEMKRMDSGAVREKWGVGPEHIRDVLALMGDSSDNIPGVPGVGEKTAVELMKQFGSLESIYERIAEITKPALKKKLEENRELAFLSRELATVRGDLDLGLPLDALGVAPIRREELAAFGRHWGIKRLENVARDQGTDAADAGASAPGRPAERRGSAAEERVAGATSPSGPAAAGATPSLFDTPAPAPAPTIAPASAPLPASLRAEPQGDLFSAAAAESAATEGPSLEALELRLHDVRARAVHGLAVVPVTFGEEPRHASLVGLALAARDGTAAYVPLAHEGGPNFPMEQVRIWLAPLLLDRNIPKVAPDLKGAMHTLAAHQLPIAGGVFDLHLASFVCDPERNHSLERLAADVLGVTLSGIEPAAVRGRTRLGPGATPVAHAAAAGERMAAACWPLEAALTAQLEAREQWKLYAELEHPLIEVLFAMEVEGVALDVPVLQAMSVDASREIAALETQLHELAGEPLNLGSSQQLGKVLFEKLGLPAKKKTKTGWSTDSEVLDELATQHEFPRLLLEWRALTKLRSTYLDALPTSVDPGDGRVHTTFEQTGAATGRLSSWNPNLQNIPMRTPLGRAIRRAFVAKPGHVLVGADYSQIELRVMAHLSGDPQLGEAFASGEDIHSSTARRIFKIEGDVPPELRSRAKVVNFGVMYGMGARSLAQQMGIELKEAKEFIEGYFSVYSGVRTFLDRTVAEARERGYVETLLGRRRWLPQLRGGGLERSIAERAAINTPIQGSAADLVKLAMLRVQYALPRHAGARLLLQVHDELLLECRAGMAPEVAEMVRREMEGCYALSVPLTVSAGIGATWYDVH